MAYNSTIPAAALLAASFLAGATMSLNFITVPVFLDITVDAPLLLSQWRRMYHYGHQAAPALAVGTCSLFVAAGMKHLRARRIFSFAAASTAAILPFTWIFMTSTNNELFQLEAASKLDPVGISIARCRELVTTWNWLHLTRSSLALSGAVLGAVGLCRVSTDEDANGQKSL